MKNLILFLALSLFTVHVFHSQTLGLNLVIGESYYHESETKIKMTQELHSEKYISEITNGGKMRYFVKGKTDSLYHLEVEFQTIYMTVNAPDIEISANSQTVDSSDVFSLLLTELTKTSFDISLTKYGIVQDVNMENVFDNLFSFDPTIPKIEKARMAYLLKQSFGEKAMKSAIEMLTAIYPEKPVKEREKWENQISLENGFWRTVENEFVLSELNKDFAIINGQSQMTSEDDTSFTEIDGQFLKFKGNGSSYSNFKIDRSTGWLIKSQINQYISGINEVKSREDSTIIIKIPFEYNGSIKLSSE